MINSLFLQYINHCEDKFMPIKRQVNEKILAAAIAPQ